MGRGEAGGAVGEMPVRGEKKPYCTQREGGNVRSKKGGRKKMRGISTRGKRGGKSVNFCIIFKKGTRRFKREGSSLKNWGGEPYL